MKKSILSALFALGLQSIVFSQKISWTYTTRDEQWKPGKITATSTPTTASALSIYPDEKLQVIDGFGGCFNELGWEALLSLPQESRQHILNSLFTKTDANFNLCRVPVGSNDYSFSYYSYDDVPEDFGMRNFNIDRDRYILIPYIKAAKQLSPDLKIWGSPWSPPAWMKVTGHYGMGPGSKDQWGSDLSAGRKIANNATAFRMEDRYLEAYALYFARYVKAYKKEGIDISRICVQNEVVYQPQWPACTWRAEDLAFFIGNYMGPRFAADSVNAEIWLGTINGADPGYMRKILDDKKAASYIKGIGMQWDAKRAIPAIHAEYPAFKTMQTESECGNGENNWASAEYTWSLINHYMNNGVSSYMYWNMVLDNTGRSSWGWVQNALININKETHQVTYNPEYYLMRHLSHFVQRNAFRIKTSGGKDHLAFINPDGSVVLILINQDDKEKTVTVNCLNQTFSASVKAKSFNTFVWKR